MSRHKLTSCGVSRATMASAALAFSALSASSRIVKPISSAARVGCWRHSSMRCACQLFSCIAASRVPGAQCSTGSTGSIGTSSTACAWRVRGCRQGAAASTAGSSSVPAVSCGPPSRARCRWITASSAGSIHGSRATARSPIPRSSCTRLGVSRPASFPPAAITRETATSAASGQRLTASPSRASACFELLAARATASTASGVPMWASASPACSMLAPGSSNGSAATPRSTSTVATKRASLQNFSLGRSRIATSSAAGSVAMVISQCSPACRSAPSVGASSSEWARAGTSGSSNSSAGWRQAGTCGRCWVMRATQACHTASSATDRCLRSASSAGLSGLLQIEPNGASTWPWKRRLYRWEEASYSLSTWICCASSSIATTSSRPWLATSQCTTSANRPSCP